MTKANRKFYRTILLGLAAMGLLIWTAMVQFDIAAKDILVFFYGTLLAAGLVILAAAVVAFLWVMMRNLMNSHSGD